MKYRIVIDREPDELNRPMAVYRWTIVCINTGKPVRSRGFYPSSTFDPHDGQNFTLENAETLVYQNVTRKRMLIDRQWEEVLPEGLGLDDFLESIKPRSK